MKEEKELVRGKKDRQTEKRWPEKERMYLFIL